MAEVQKTADEAEQTSVKKTPESAAVSGVIGGQTNQEIHGQALVIAHSNDKTLSEPDMIAMGENETPAEYSARVAQIQMNRFGFYDSEQQNTDPNKTQIAQASADTATETKNPPYGQGSDGRWNFQNPQLKPGQDLAGAMKEWFWNDAKNLPSDTVNDAWALSEPLLKAINEWMQRKPDMTYMEYLTGFGRKMDARPGGMSVLRARTRHMKSFQSWLITKFQRNDFWNHPQ